MRRLGKLVMMTKAEYDHDGEVLLGQMCLAADNAEHADDFAEELSRAYAKVALAEAVRDDAVALSRRFHAAGGYSHTLPKVKEQLAHATESLAHCIDLLVKWRPLVASLETTPGQFVDRQFDTQVSITRELCGIRLGLRDKVLSDISDLDAPADFLLVSEQVQQERKWQKPNMTREEYDSLFIGCWKTPAQLRQP